MQIGVVYPQTEYGNDPSAIRDYAQAVEDLGFNHILAYDHVLGANPNRPGGWTGSYTHQSAFHEPFVLFSFMASATRRISFAPSIIILPQRQTALVAKQAATLDVLSGGRLRLGVGLGWNEVEYTALNEDFRNRGQRIEEQVEVLRLLWTQPLVDFHGRWHSIPDAGLNPLPVQQPIPIWFGGGAEPAIRRAVQLGDGWMPNYPSVQDARPALDLLERSLVESGRERSSLGIEARLPYGDGVPQTWRKLMEEWRLEGATHLSINTMGIGLSSPAEHIAVLRVFAEEMEIG